MSPSGDSDHGLEYAERRDRFGRESEALARRSRAVSYARLLIALAIAIAVTGVLTAPALRQTLLIAGVVLVLLFVGLIRLHDGIESRVRWREVLRRLNDEGLHRVRREWDALAAPPRIDLPDGHPYAADLHLFGRVSLVQLVGPMGSPFGVDTLRRWLLAPADPPDIVERQAAVAALAPLLDFRDGLAAHGRLGPTGTLLGAERLLAWAEDAPWLSIRPAVVWSARALTVLSVAVVLAVSLGLAGPGWLLVPVSANGLMLSRVGSRVRATLARVVSSETTFRQYASLLEHVERVPMGVPLLRSVAAALRTGDGTASHAMRRLWRLADLAQARYSPMLHLPLQLLLLWDLHVLHALERWQRTSGRHARPWLERLGEVEALSALAALHYDNPGWVFPEIVPGALSLEAEAIAHPLLADEIRVANDVAVGPPGTFLMVTGSNMSGKSTLLRAIGVNVVLAQAGAPVCAARLSMPPVALETNMRAEDSLERGLSRFMAELQRLKEIVDAAKDDRRRPSVRGPTEDAAGDRGPRRVLLYLIDEMLQGTNSAERQVAARRILHHLLERGAIGAVTSHDLSLAEPEELAGAAKLVHFTESFADTPEGPQMTFDYKLRPGLATSVNALRLMEMVGLK